VADRGATTNPANNTAAANAADPPMIMVLVSFTFTVFITFSSPSSRLRLRSYLPKVKELFATTADSKR
jgi:hypothetical protein